MADVPRHPRTFSTAELLSMCRVERRCVMSRLDSRQRVYADGVGGGDTVKVFGYQDDFATAELHWEPDGAYQLVVNDGWHGVTVRLGLSRVAAQELASAIGGALRSAG
jgi:hypothetical protein